ncbi:hypothetical protein GCM10027444_19600 [Actinopolyspora lacussalsi]
MRVYELDSSDCSVVRFHSVETDTYDVVNLGRRADGTLWLADTGDNSSRRDTVALHVIDPSGATELYRMKCPDGPHDAEALLLGREGNVHLVTKNPLGAVPAPARETSSSRLQRPPPPHSPSGGPRQGGASCSASGEQSSCCCSS